MWTSRVPLVWVLSFGMQAHATGQLLSAPSAATQQQRQSSQRTPAPERLSDPYHETPSTPSGVPPSGAQEPVLHPTLRSETDETVTIRKRVDEVSMIFTVTDKRGRFVRDLTRGEFRILDDNKPPQAVLSFRGETDLPLRVGLLVDASNSVRDRFRFEQEAAVQFLNQNIRPRYDKAFVIGFDSTIEVTQDYTDDTEKLTNGVRVLRPGGGTALYDAFYFACRDKLLKGAQEHGPVRRAIILLSDGEDNQSHVTREEAIEMAQRAEAIVYAISTNINGQKLRGDKVLERIAEATGGRAFFPFQMRDVEDAFTEIQDELRSQYALAYKPADFRSDGRFRAVVIEAQNRKGLRVRARRGYYAPQQ